MTFIASTSVKTQTYLVVIVTLIALIHTGCAQQCAQISTDYKQVLGQEAQIDGGQTLGPGMPTHMGVALRFDLVRDVARTLLVKALSDKLDLNSNINIGSGKNIPVELSSDALNIGFDQDDACETCFRITGNLGGDASVKIPLLGTKKIPLSGAFNMIAPIQFESDADNTVRVRLDPSKVADYSESFLSLDLNGLPEAIGRSLKQPLTKQLFTRLTSRLKPMDLFAFKAPEFGIKGIKLFPSQLTLMPKQKAIFLGFTSNIPGIGSGQGLNAAKAIEFGEQENMAVAIQPSMIKGLITTLMQQDVIPRRYTMQGASKPDGPAHVTLNAVNFANGGQDAQQDPLNIGFRAWNLFGQSGGPCFWFDALVKGVITLKDRKLNVDLQNVELVNASVAPQLIQSLADWKGAAFLDKTRNLIETTLSEPQISVPGGGSLTLAPSSLDRDNTTIALRSLVKFKGN